MQYHSHIEDKLPVEFPLEFTSFSSDLTFFFLKFSLRNSFVLSFNVI